MRAYQIGAAVAVLITLTGIRMYMEADTQAEEGAAHLRLPEANEAVSLLSVARSTLSAAAMGKLAESSLPPVAQGPAAAPPAAAPPAAAPSAAPVAPPPSPCPSPSKAPLLPPPPPAPAAVGEASEWKAVLTEHGGFFTELFTPEADAGKETLFKCASYGTFADVCVYRRLCFKGPTEVVFVANTPPRVRGGRIPAQLRLMGMKMSTKLPPTKWVTEDLPDGRYVPTYFKGSGVHHMTPEELAAKNPKWSDRMMVMPAYQEQLGNIWYYASRVLPMFTVMTHGPRMGIPSLENSDVLIMGPSHKIKHDWHLNVLNLSLPLSANVYYEKDDKYAGLKSGITCTDTAVLTGAQVYGFSDWITSHTFRARAYRSVGITVPNPPVNDVIILDRGAAKPRHISNAADVVGLVKSFGYAGERVIIDDRHTFEFQVKLMARAGVLICVHGAGLMNTVFMAPGSVVIEVFPVHAKHVLYERVAHYAGVYHFKVYSNVFEKNYHVRHPQYKQNECDKVKSLDIPESAKCWSLVKNSNVVVPIPELREALVHALDFVTRFKDPDIQGEEGDYAET